jgi:N-acetylneuraminate synthase
VILSTGMSTIDEVEAALGVLAFGYLQPNADPSTDGFRAAYASPDGQREISDNVVLLHCTSEYPAPVDEVNLRAMDTLRTAFDLPVGLSDHTRGTSVPIAAVARGASVVEKHFTLDRTLPGPDHEASLEPDELKGMVDGIRRVEEALGSRCKRPTRSESKNRRVVRKSLVAADPIDEGEPFTTQNLTTKRPGRGVSPMRYWEMLSQRASRDYAPDELIDE